MPDPAGPGGDGARPEARTSTFPAGPAGRPRHLPPGTALGAAAGALGVGLSLALRLWVGLPGILDVVGSGLVILLPGPVFGRLIDSVQERGRPLLILGMALLVIAVGAVVGWLAGRGARGRLRPISMWLGLWLLTLPLVLLVEGSVLSTATWTTLLEWGVVTLTPGLAIGGQSRRASPVRDLSAATLSRRRFLELGGAAVGAAAVGYLSAGVIRAAPPALPKISGATVGRLPTPITPVADFYVVSKDLLGPPRIDPRSWRLRIEGKSSAALTYADLKSFPLVEQVQTLECISNPVGGTLISNGRWSGPRLRSLMSKVGVPSSAHYVVFGCADGYTESLPLEEASLDTTLVAFTLDGRPLPPRHGFPARILLPGHYGMKDPKWLTRVSFQNRSYSGYWEQQGWNPAALPKIFARFDFPVASTRLASGRRYRLSGVAYAGAAGVREVQLSTDGGRLWSRAELESPLSAYSWTIWSLEWAPRPGLYGLAVRAVDSQGRVQSGVVASSFPAGSSGYQRLQVVVA